MKFKLSKKAGSNGIRVLVSITLALLSATFLLAQNRTLSIDQCIQLAIDQNLDLKQLEVQENLAGVNLQVDKQKRYPSLSGNTNFQLSTRAVDPTNNGLTSSTFYYQGYGMNTGILLYNGGIIHNQIKKSKLELEKIALTQDDGALNIIQQILNQFLQISILEENIKIAKEQLKNAEARLTEIDKRIKSGMVAENDRYSFESSVLNEQQNLLQQEGNLELAYFALKQTLRLPVEESFVIDNTDLVQAFDVSQQPIPHVNDVYQKVLNNHPALQLIEQNLSINSLDQKIATGGLFPRISMFGSLNSNYSSQGKKIVGYESSIVDRTVVLNGVETTIGFKNSIPKLENQPYIEQLNNTLALGTGINIAIPLYNNGASRANIQRTKLARKSIEIEYEKKRYQIYQQISQAILEAQQAKISYETAIKTRKVAKIAVESADKKLKAGNGNAFQIQLAENQYAIAAQRVTIAYYTYIFKAKIISLYQNLPSKIK